MPAEALEKLQHYTPRPASPNGEIESIGVESMPPVPQHRHPGSSTCSKHYPGSEISSAECQLCDNSALTIGEGFSVRSQLTYGDLSIFPLRAITPPTPPSIAVNNIHLSETTMLSDMELEDVSKHLAVAQRPKYVFCNPSKFSNPTMEQPPSHSSPSLSVSLHNGQEME